MTPSEYQDLFGFLAKKFDGIDRRFEGMDQRFDRMDVRFDGLEGRFDGLEGRFDGLEGRFDGLEGRFDGLEGRVDGLANRLSAVEVGQESLRSDLRTVAELVTTNGRRIDENRLAIETLTEKVELNGVGIRAVRDRVAALEDHLRAV